MSFDARISRSRALLPDARWVCALVLALLALLAPGQVVAQNLCVGNLVYKDGDGNGVYSFNEGVGDVRVEIWRATGDLEVPYVMAATLQTQSSGFYLFQNLPAGSYFVTIPASEFGVGEPLHGLLSLPGAAFLGDDDTSEDGQDSFDPSITGISTIEFVVEAGFGPTGTAELGFAGTVDDLDDANGDMTVDFGFYQPVGVGNLVFSDNDGNGKADPGEGIPGVVVQLYYAVDDPETDAPVTDLITDSEGFFLFGGLTPGDYKLHIPSWQFQEGGTLEGSTSLAGVGLANDDDDAVDAGDNGIDDVNPALNGITSGVISLEPGLSPTGGTGETGAGSGDDDASDTDYNLTVDFGFSFPPNRLGLGNVVFVDLDANGHFDDGEGMGDVVVELFLQGDDPESDSPVAIRTTRPDGTYLFGNLEEGNYFLHIPKEQFVAGAPLFSALSVTGVTAGDDELGEEGIDMPYPELTGVSTGVFALLAGSSPTDGTGETGFGYDSDNFRDSRVDLTRDMGFVLRASSPLAVGNLVFSDTNANGHQDPGEDGIEGVTVQLFYEGANPLSATPVAFQQTLSDGTYFFTNLTPGRYFVYVPSSQFGSGGPLEGYMSSPGNAGDTDLDDDEDENGIDSAEPATTGIASVVFELSDNQEPVESGVASHLDDDDEDNGNLTIDLGFATNCAVLTITPTSLSNATIDSAYSQAFTLNGTVETPVWTVSSGSLPTGLTLSTAGLLSGTPTVSGSFAFDVMAEILGDCQTTLSLTLEVLPLSNLRVGNTVFVDTNHNGHYDDGEGWTGVQLQLFNEGDDTSAPAVQSTASGVDGSYAFTGLTPGRYFIHVPAGQFLDGAPLYQTVSIPGAGKDLGIDDDVDENGVDSATPATTGISSIVFELEAGAEPTDLTGETGRAGNSDNVPDDEDGDTTIDFGFMAGPEISVGLGNLVFRDANNNQVFDADEGVDGVMVQLFHAADDPLSAAPISQVTTANEGRYAFMGLEPGSYKVYVPASQFNSGGPLYGCLSIAGAGTPGTADDDIDEDGIDSPNPTVTGIVSSVVTLAMGSQPGNAVETGVDGILDDVADTNTDLTVDLGFARNCQTMLIAPGTLTDSLVDAPYAVQFTASAGVAPYVFTPAFGLLPPGLTLDSSGLLSGTPTVIGTYNFGVQVTDEYGCLNVQGFTLVITSPPLGVGNLIFFDRNNNGHADEGEGVDGVTVELYLSTDTPGNDDPVASTITAGGGRYLIDNLQPGAFLLHVPKEMFLASAPLWSMKSVPGVLNSGDDESGEDGQDALDPTLTGVTTMAFNLSPGTSPADTDESGLDGDADDVRDGDVDLTRDLGFVDATNLPATYTDWLSVHSLTGPTSGPTGNGDGDDNSNLLEYALGGDPSSGGRPVDDGFVINENQATGEMYVQVRRRHGGQADLAYEVQIIANLTQSPGGWVPISLLPEIVNNGDGTETLMYGPLESDPLFAGASLGFVRVRVVLDANHDTTPEATDATQVLGWQHRSMVTQHQTYSMPFVQPAAFTGLVDGVLDNVLDATTSAGSASLSGMLQSGREYYVEVLNGALEGHRWEVDEAACTPTTIALLPAHARSTRIDVPVSVAGLMVALRAHWRVIDLFPVGDFHATLSPNTADTLQFWDNATSGYTTYWLVNAPTGQKWVRVGDASLLSKNDAVIAPCDGLFVRPRVGTVGLGAVGQVRSWDVVCPLKTGISFVGNPYPVAMSPASREMSVAGGFTGGGNANNADKFNFWTGDDSSTTSYVTYYLFKNVSMELWLRVGDASLADRTNELLFPPTTAFFMTSLAGQPTWKIPAPWAP